MKRPTFQTPIDDTTSDTSYKTILDITGKGIVYEINSVHSTFQGQIKITIDGEVFEATIDTTKKYWTSCTTWLSAGYNTILVEFAESLKIQHKAEVSGSQTTKVYYGLEE